MSHLATVPPRDPFAAPSVARAVAASARRPLHPLGLIRTALARWMEADRRYRVARQMIDLPDHLLRDIGVTRGDLRFEARRERKAAASALGGSRPTAGAAPASRPARATGHGEFSAEAADVVTP